MALSALLVVTAIAVVAALNSRMQALEKEAWAYTVQERNAEQVAQLQARLQAAEYEAEMAADAAGISVHCAANGRCFTIGAEPVDEGEP